MAHIEEDNIKPGTRPAVTDLESGTAVVADLVARHIAPVELAIDGPDDTKVPLLVLPTGLRVQELKKFLDPYRTAPERREGCAKLVELASFIDHANRFKDEASALFACPAATAPSLTAVLDYHRPGATGSPRFGKHRGFYEFPMSAEWLAWMAKNGQTMAQADFATFLEDRIIDVADPGHAFTSAKLFAESLGIPSFASPPMLLQLSRGLTVHVDERVTSRINPSTGETTMLFSTDHNDADGAPLAIPRAFLIQIPVFRAGITYQFPVRLKYRAGGGRVSWSYELHDPGRAFDDAFREACEMAAEKTELPLFYGAPEA